MKKDRSDELNRSMKATGSEKEKNEIEYEPFSTDRDSSGRENKAGSILADDLLQEPSGAVRYAQNTELEYMEQKQHRAGQDPRIPAGGGHTEEEYLSLPDDLRVELIDGVFYAMASPSRIHQTVCIEIVRQLADCVEEHEEPCYVYIAPSDVALGDERKTIVQPDIYVHCDREKDTRPGPYRGAPDFAVEVLSPSNPEHDLWRKRELYRRHGVREYWIVDPRGLNVYVFHFEKLKNDGEAGETPEKYSFEDLVPVGISGETCRVDFRRVFRKIRHFLED